MIRFKWKPLAVEVCMIASDKKYPSKTLAPTNEVVNSPLDEKEKGEVRNPASGKGDMGNPITNFFKSFARFHLD